MLQKKKKRETEREQRRTKKPPPPPTHIKCYLLAGLPACAGRRGPGHLGWMESPNTWVGALQDRATPSLPGLPITFTSRAPCSSAHAGDRHIWRPITATEPPYHHPPRWTLVSPSCDKTTGSERLSTPSGAQPALPRIPGEGIYGGGAVPPKSQNFH